MGGGGSAWGNTTIVHVTRAGWCNGPRGVRRLLPHSPHGWNRGGSGRGEGGGAGSGWGPGRWAGRGGGQGRAVPGAPLPSLHRHTAHGALPYGAQ